MNRNLFSVLERNNSSPENYLTESFVFVLRTLLEKEKKIGIRLLSIICSGIEGIQYKEEDNIVIETQEATEEGRPDISISSDECFVYIEVKRDSPIGQHQISTYRSMLRKRGKCFRSIILLTKSQIQIENDESPDKNIYWYEIHRWLTDELPKIQDLVCKYLIMAFIQYLEVAKMAIQRITWEYERGVFAFNNLMQMLEVAIRDTKLKISRFSSGWDFKGYYIERAHFFCGIYYERPLVICFEKYERNTTTYTEKLDLADSTFFCQSANEQTRIIRDFVAESYKKLKV
jgi:hypothetical protein